MDTNKLCTIVCLSLLLGVSRLDAANWPHWRGPQFNGASAETNLPADWSLDRGLAWTAELPGCSAATPIVWGDRVFISSVDEQREVVVALCLDRASGRQVWRHDVGKGIRRDDRSTYASASPVTDGRMVAFFYSTGELVAYDFAGERLWERNLHSDFGPFAYQWTYGSSPTLFDGRLYVQVLQRDVPVRGRGWNDKPNESYLLAVDPQTGKTLWRQIRPSEAVAESHESFATPIPATLEGRPQILVVGGDDQTGHDPDTGVELWRWGTWNPRRIGHYRHVPSPVVGDGIVLICGPKREPVFALKPNGSGKLNDSAIQWRSDTIAAEVTSDVPTPAFYDGDFFILSDLRKRLMRVAPKTGKVKWMVETPGKKKYEASPLLGDGKIYAIDHAGEVAIFNAVDGALIKTIVMDRNPSDRERVRASIVASEGQLFIRTGRHLHCVGNP
jgi:outer membrane protein assembly factor BamB